MKRHITSGSILACACLGFGLLTSVPALAATWPVTSSGDAGVGTLRQAIADASSGDTIVFDMAQVSSPITLLSGEVVIDKSLTIQGPGAAQLAISGNHASAVFLVLAPFEASPLSVTIEGLSIQDGLGLFGGGVDNEGCLLTIKRCVLSGNEASLGGAIYNYGTLRVEECTIKDNFAADGGGGIINDFGGGPVVIASSTLSGNASGSTGGGLFNLGPLTMINSTVSGNSAYYGGGIFNYVINETVTLDISHCTLSGNEAVYGGGIYCQPDGALRDFASLRLGHVLLAAGASGGNYEDFAANLAASDGYNLADDDTLAAFLTSAGDHSGEADLLLGPLQDNGGPTFTHALLPGGPAINAGNPAFQASSLSFDQRSAGFARVADGVVDIGAFELSGCDTPVVTITGVAGGWVHAVNTPVTLTASFTGENAPHAAQWSVGGTVVAQSLDEATKTASVTVVFSSAGVYPFGVTVANACGNQGSADSVGGQPAAVVIHAPAVSFVTGGGWINSPAGAAPRTPKAAGKANLNLACQYEDGARVPAVDVGFNLKSANLRFVGAAGDWLVVNGALAQCQGTGTVNDQGRYGFLLTVKDGKLGGGADTYRMKIWDATSGQVIYANEPGLPDSATPTTRLGGGSIVIHR